MTASHCYNTKAIVKALLTSSLITPSVKAGNAGSQTEGALLFFCVGLVCTENFFALLFFPFVPLWKRRVALLRVSNAKCALVRANQTPESWRLLFRGWLSLCFFSQLTLRAAHMPTALYSPLLFLSFLIIPLLFNLFYFLKPLSARMVLASLEGELLDTLHSFLLEMHSI